MLTHEVTVFRKRVTGRDRAKEQIALDFRGDCSRPAEDLDFQFQLSTSGPSS